MQIVHIGTYFSGLLGSVATQARLFIDTSTQTPRLTVTNLGQGLFQTLGPTSAGQYTQVLDSGVPDNGRVALDLPGSPNAGLESALVDQAFAMLDMTFGPVHSGSIQGQVQRAGSDYLAAVSVLAVRGDSGDLLVVAEADRQGITVYQRTDSGLSDPLNSQIDSPFVTLTAVSAMVAVTMGNSRFLYTASATEHGITGFDLSDTGVLTALHAAGPDQGLPVQTLTSLGMAQFDGATYLVAAAADSSSLTVLRVAEDGSLTLVDHVIDSLDTRFGGVAHMAVVTHGSRVFVVAAGNDAGLTLFALTAEGRLVTLHSFEDTFTTALGGISSMNAAVRVDTLDIFTVSGSEPGLSQFRVDLSGFGQFGGMTGGAGDDILIDDGGSDTLRGGAGQDIFVLTADGTRNRIADAEPWQDRIDLSDWLFFYSADQLTVQTRSWGARILFREEELDIHSATGTPLSAQDVAGMLIWGGYRFDLPVQSTPVLPSIIADGTAGNDSLIGGDGNDFLRGLEGNDTLRGYAGDDSLVGGDGDDRLIGDDGNDNMAGGNGNDTLIGGLGHDSLGGGFGNDYLSGGAGNDYGGGGPGHDSILGGDGNDFLSAGWGRDTLHGQDGHDWLAGSYDPDSVTGGSGDDTIGGGTGNDTIYGGTGNDNIGAGDDDDLVYGEDGNDFLGGGAGNDRLDGGAGNDTLNGGYGDDTLIGGAGADVFVFNANAGDGRNTITDFEIGTDILRLVGLHPGPAGGRLEFLNLRETVSNGNPVTLLDYGDHTLRLIGIASDQISEDDFQFL